MRAGRVSGKFESRGPPASLSSLAAMRRTAAILLVLFVSVATVAYIRTHPLVFNESFFEHGHCIKGAGLAISTYAQAHGGRFPFNTNGYGDALLSLTNEISGWWASV